MDTLTIFCPCGCGSQVSAHDAGPAATTVTVDACEARREAGLRSLVLEKSAVEVFTWDTTALRAVARTRERADKARGTFEQAIRNAHAAGHSTRAIAPAARLSHQRVHQIIH